MMAEVYGHNPKSCRICSHKVKKHKFYVKMKDPDVFNNRKQELVTMKKLLLDLIIKKVTLEN